MHVARRPRAESARSQHTSSVHTHLVAAQVQVRQARQVAHLPGHARQLAAAQQQAPQARQALQRLERGVVLPLAQHLKRVVRQVQARQRQQARQAARQRRRFDVPALRKEAGNGGCGTEGVEVSPHGAAKRSGDGKQQQPGQRQPAHRSSRDSRAGSLATGSQVWASPTIRLVPAAQHGTAHTV